MRNQERTCLVLVGSLLLTFSFIAIYETAAQSNQFILEKEQHWETYKVGGTCIPGTHNFFIADVDSDGVLEMITGGFMYLGTWGNQTTREAPLKIWNFNGQNISLEKSQNWPGNIGCVYAGDANGDGSIEIITVGSVRNSTGSYPQQLRIWQWNGEALVLKGSYEGTSISSVVVSDVDKDGKPEIISVGRYSNSTQFCARLRVWRWDGSSLTLKKNLQWGSPNATGTSVYAYDLDNNGVNEIITAGYVNNLKNSSGQLRIWQWNGEDYSLKADEEWRLKDGYGLTSAGGVQGNTMVNNVKVGDVDGDGSPEIITGGFTYDGEKTNAQLRIWNWNGQALTLEKSQEWTTQDIVEVKSMSINDVDGDGRKEIVTSGVSLEYGSFYSNSPEIAQLRVWSWDGTTLVLKQSNDWYIDEGATAWNVATGDVDKDGTIEIVTVGCTSLADNCDPDMRIWSILNETASPNYLLFAGAGILIAAVLSIAFLWVRKKRK